MAIALDPDLFRRIAALHAERDRLELAPDQLRLIERQHLSLVRAGALLLPAEKERMRAISERLATLHTQFGQNVLHDEKAWQLVLGEDELDGLPAFVRSAAAGRRAPAGSLPATSSRWRGRRSSRSFSFSGRRDLRQAAYEAWTERGAHAGPYDNVPLVREFLVLRAEQARLLGYEHYAAYRLDDTMAKNVAAAKHLLQQVWEPGKRKAAAERAASSKPARLATNSTPRSRPWDWRYYAEKVRRAKYEIDEAEVKPYFMLDNMVRAAFATAERLFGVTFTARTDLPALSPGRARL